MNNKINDGGPAFPVTLDHRGCAGAYGMTLRDWFAGQAIVGILSSPEAPSDATIAGYAYNLADAMIAAREVKP